MYIRTAISTVALALASAACSKTTPTKITDTWRDPTYTAGPVKNLVIIGASMNSANRRTVEDSFASAMMAHGIRATPSYQLFPDQLPSRADARNALQKGGYDSALVANMKGMRQTVTVEPGAWEGGFYDYYGAWGAPAYVETDEFVKFETTLWDARGNGKLIWAAVSQTENPSSAKDFATSLVNKVVPALADAGLIPPATPVARVTPPSTL